MNQLRVRMKAYIQPFERSLALHELRAASNAEPKSLESLETSGTMFEIVTARTKAELASRLTYWETVEGSDGKFVTRQSLRESTVNLVRNGIALDTLRKILPFRSDVPFPNRRCLRYGTHGIHEYRGKFFPQLVRSLINISGIPAGGVVADPMSGSGTTAVESILAGYEARGIDMNPLSVFLGATKCRLLNSDPSVIASSYEEIRAVLMSVEPVTSRWPTYFSTLPTTDQQYLSSWFSEDVLSGLDEISCAINEISDRNSRDLMRVSLSNILRSVSWQKEADLRVRKEIRLDVEIDPKKEFLEELGRSVRAVLAFLYQNGPSNNVKFEISEGDARNCDAAWGDNSIDLIITSPPYATALPYLDTDRLSLCYLGLLPRPEHRAKDYMMIGNREVSEKLRSQYYARFKTSGNALPISIQQLIQKIDKLNSGANVGFRRKNLPALLAKYFFDMSNVLEGMYKVLKPGKYAFVVVGNNHTIAGGQKVDINTAALLQDIAQAIGFDVAPPLSMDMLVSRDIFSKNAMASEEILAFRKPI